LPHWLLQQLHARHDCECSCALGNNIEDHHVHDLLMRCDAQQRHNAVRTAKTQCSVLIPLTAEAVQLYQDGDCATLFYA
jgi:hypothetical protein